MEPLFHRPESLTTGKRGHAAGEHGKHCSEEQGRSRGAVVAQAGAGVVRDGLLMSPSVAVSRACPARHLGGSSESHWKGRS